MGLSTRDAEALLLQMTQQQIALQNEALAVYRPTPTQLDFHLSNASERILRGGHRSGKSTTGAVELAHAATGEPIIGPDGKPLPDKYPRNRPLTIWIIGKDEKHIGGTIHKLLFKTGMFYTIRDRVTHQMRTWDPENPDDQARISERGVSRPLIPKRMIREDGWGWTSKRENIFSVCRLNNGNEIWAYPSGGNCPSGVPVDLLWIDEDIMIPEYVADWQGRLIDRGGRFMWTAFPWAKNDALRGLCDRAEAEADNPRSEIKQWVLVTSKNKYLDPKERQKARDRWAAAGESVLNARDGGEFPDNDILMYPEFDRDTHGIDAGSRCPNCEAARIIQKNNGEPPADWMRFLALDPGSQKACVLFGAVPPPALGDYVVIYDEVFQKHSDARMLAKAVAPIVHGRSFRAFIIDGHAARQTPLGFGRTIRDEYVTAFRELNIQSENGTSFVDGSDNVPFRTMEVRSRLRKHDISQPPRLLFWLPKTPRTQWEFMKYRRTLTNNEYSDKPVAVHNDAMNCLEYMIAARATWLLYSEPMTNSHRQQQVERMASIVNMFLRGQRQSASVVMG